MSRKGDGNKRRGSGLLSEEDRDLWQFVARSIGPTRGKSRVRDVEPDFEALTADYEAYHRSQPKRAPAPPARGRQPAATSHPPPVVAPAGPSVAPKHAMPPPSPQPLQLERRKARRIAKGTEDIEARLDLHGMTQADAHAALIGFIRRSAARGLRTVLVITGKGGQGGDRGGPSRIDHDGLPRERGVLKRNVPRWLAGHELGSLVVGYTTAHIRHGGEGALYVRLRRKS